MAQHLQQRYVKTYRNRIRAANLHTVDQKKVPLTAAERMREWRRRCKEVAQGVNVGASTSKVPDPVPMEVDTAEYVGNSESATQETLSPVRRYNTRARQHQMDRKHDESANNPIVTSNIPRRYQATNVIAELHCKASKKHRIGPPTSTAAGLNNIDSDDKIYVRSPEYIAFYEGADKEFQKAFHSNGFGHVCSICDRLWFKNNLKPSITKHHELLHLHFPSEDIQSFDLCSTCRKSVNAGKIPALSKSNGFVYPDYPTHLPPLDPISERLISPRLPFMQIRRLRHEIGSYGIIGQVINVPVDVDNMVRQLPRQLDEDHAFNVNIKKHIIHKSSYLSGFVKKMTVRRWLQCLVKTPLYRRYEITYNDNLLQNTDASQKLSDGENIALEMLEDFVESEVLIARQHTLLWNEDKCLEIAPGQHAQPLNILYDPHAEELSFPAIYLGHPRTFNLDVRVTPFMMATSEIRRRDRRGVTPQHILYMAMKILRLRVTEGLRATFKCVAGTAKITRKMIEDKQFLEHCVEKNLSFLKSIPNSVQYWIERKKDLFAMIRQLGKPTMFLTISANEIRWPHLLKTLHRLSCLYPDVRVEDALADLNSIQRTTLVNEDPVTCCIYFNKLVDTIMRILGSTRRYNAFGKYRIVDYFKRIEFQHRGSPHAHILVWLQNDPREVASEDMVLTVKLVTDLCSIAASDLPDSYGNQVHKHTFTCYKRGDKSCRFNIPYWPMDRTRVLLPITKEDGRRQTLIERGKKIRVKLEQKAYDTLNEFLIDSGVTLLYYLDVVRASLRRPTVMHKRGMSELWTNSFNPWIARVLNSNMDLQFILEEYSCAAYVVEYVNKSNRGISNLQRELIGLQDQYPEQDYTALLKSVSLKMLNSVEMSSQEAAWYLLRQPMSECSRDVSFVPTMMPHERTKARKKVAQMDEEGVEEDSTDVWTKNIIEKYELREDMHDVCLADFVAWHTKIGGRGNANVYRKRDRPRVIRYRHYDMTQLADYKREMVLLYVPFRSEIVDILDCNKFLEIYDVREHQILQKRKEYESDMNLEQTIEEYRKMCVEINDTEKAEERRAEFVKSVTLQENNDDIEQMSTRSLTSVVRQRINVMRKDEYCAMVRKTNPEQRDLVLQAIHGIDTPNTTPLQIFFTGPAGCGKTFTLSILMETYNRFTQSHNSIYNTYVACASTGKAAVAMGGTTVHSAFRLTMSRRNTTLACETLQTYRNAFVGVKVIIVDEVSMIGADLLLKMNNRLQEITSNYNDPFGGMSIIFCGDLRQLPPVNALPIFKPCRNTVTGAVLWQSLKFFPLVNVMRQSDVVFSNILTKVGNGDALERHEIQLLESRFRTPEWCNQNVPKAIRLFHRNNDVESYNREAISSSLASVADDVLTGYKNQAQLTSARTKLFKMSVVETGGLPYLVSLATGFPFMVTTNVDVEDGIVNGAIGVLKHIEYEDAGDATTLSRLWLHFENSVIGAKHRVKARPLVASKPGVLSREWTPIAKRTTNIGLSGSIKCRRIQFPLVPACAITIHKSQGGTFSEVVFQYGKTQQHQLVYVALSRVTSLDGLYLTSANGDFRFYHGVRSTAPSIKEIRDEFQRLNSHRLCTISDEARTFLDQSTERDITLISLNVQSLVAHWQDIETDDVLMRADYLAVNETWLDNKASVDIARYRCVNKAKSSPNSRAGGVAIYERHGLSTQAIPHSLQIPSSSPTASPDSTPSIISDKFGDICAVELSLKGEKVILIAVYIHPGISLARLKVFMIKHLSDYSTTASTICSEVKNTSTDKLPIVITGDFNIDIRKPENKTFLEFMKTHFNLKSINSAPTTSSGSCLDLIFVRHLVVRFKPFITYFSFHKPLLTIISPMCLNK